jgi:hypothetical protein
MDRPAKGMAAWLHGLTRRDGSKVCHNMALHSFTGWFCLLHGKPECVYSATVLATGAAPT